VVEGAVESIVGPTKKAAQGTKLQLIVDKSLPKKILFYNGSYHHIPLLKNDQYKRIRRWILIVYTTTTYTFGIGWYT
jgi:hypothetical protein